MPIRVNTQYMRNSNFVYVLKMEYVPKINIFGLKMMVTIHHKFFFEIPPCGKKVLFITEFAISCKSPHFYEVK